MYLDYLVDVPEVKGKITFRSKGNARYVYYEYDRIYDPDKKYTTVKRVTIGKVSADDELKMRPNENFKKYFPEAETAVLCPAAFLLYYSETVSARIKRPVACRYPIF